VSSGRGDFERALGAFLTLDVFQIEPGGAQRSEFRLGRRQELSSLEMIDDRQEGGRGDDLDLAGPCRLPATRRRADDTDPPACSGERG